jgi:hypothetical protein
MKNGLLVLSILMSANHVFAAQAASDEISPSMTKLEAQSIGERIVGYIVKDPIEKTEMVNEDIFLKTSRAPINTRSSQFSFEYVERDGKRIGAEINDGDQRYCFPCDAGSYLMWGIFEPVKKSPAEKLKTCVLAKSTQAISAQKASYQSALARFQSVSKARIVTRQKRGKELMTALQAFESEKARVQDFNFQKSPQVGKTEEQALQLAFPEYHETCVAELALATKKPAARKQAAGTR